MPEVAWSPPPALHLVLVTEARMECSHFCVSTDPHLSEPRVAAEWMAFEEPEHDRPRRRGYR